MDREPTADPRFRLDLDALQSDPRRQHELGAIATAIYWILIDPSPSASAYRYLSAEDEYEGSVFDNSVDGFMIVYRLVEPALIEFWLLFRVTRGWRPEDNGLERPRDSW